MTEDEMVGWHHRLSGHDFEQTAGDSEGQGSMVCYSPWGCKESDMTEQLNNRLIVQVIPACDSCNPAFLMIFSAYKLNKQGDSMQPCHTPFPSLNQPIVPCPVLTVDS